MSSSMAELMAAYSPPMPMPVMKRKSRNDHRLKDREVAAAASRYTPREIMNSFLRPKRSVSQPKKIAPKHAPEM